MQVVVVQVDTVVLVVLEVLPEFLAVQLVQVGVEVVALAHQVQIRLTLVQVHAVAE